MRKIIILICMIGVILSTSACNTGSTGNVIDPTNIAKSDMFTVIDKTGVYFIVYNTKTKVMYAVSRSTHNYGNFTLLVNADGTPMTYEGE